MRFSHLYCRWYGISFSNQIIQLPFGLLIKWSDGTRIEEVLAMEAARKAGMPVPRVICYGEHPDMPHAPVSILMTRLPGHELGEVYKSLSQTEKDTVLFEMKAYLSSMRKWKNPWGEHRICSSSGTSIRSVRVPLISMGPFETEKEMNDYLLYPAGFDMYDNDDDFPALKKRVDKLFDDKHDIVYTHGDLKHHNILVHGGHVSGFIDWESAGWYPEYWEFTTALRFQREDFWWYDFVLRLSDHKYLVYKDAEQALTRITGDWYAW
ncbi:APH-domain-containing protein, partial [Aureobasidium melanogenum]